MKVNHLEILKQIIVERAQLDDYVIDQNPPNLLEPHLRTATFISKISGQLLPQKIHPFERMDMDSTTVGPYSILISNLKDATTASVALRSYYTQAAIARGSLGGRDSDLYLFLIGPAGAKSDEQWQCLAHTIERDESICRKLVWLPSEAEDVDTIRRDAETFCDRTFLARPWQSSQQAVQHDLDAINAIYEKLRAGFTEHTRLSADVLRRWLRILEQSDELPKVAHSLFLSSKEAK